MTNDEMMDRIYEQYHNGNLPAREQIIFDVGFLSGRIAMLESVIKAADALAKAVNVWEDREFGDLEDDMRQAVIDARAAYEKVRLRQ